MFGQEAKLAALINRNPPQVPNEQTLVAELVTKLGPGADPDKLLFQIRSARGKTHWAVNSYLRDVMTSSLPGQEDFQPSRPARVAAAVATGAGASAASASAPPPPPSTDPASGALGGGGATGGQAAGGDGAGASGSNDDPTTASGLAAATGPTCAATAPTCAATAPTCAATAPTGAATAPTGAATAPSGAATAPTGAGAALYTRVAPTAVCVPSAPLGSGSLSGPGPSTPTLEPQHPQRVQQSTPQPPEAASSATGGVERAADSLGGAGGLWGASDTSAGGCGGGCLDSLPVSLLEALFRYLDYRSLCAAAMTNKAMSAAASSDSLWSSLYASRWGSLVFPTEPHLGTPGPGAGAAGAGSGTWPGMGPVPGAMGPCTATPGAGAAVARGPASSLERELPGSGAGTQAAPKAEAAATGAEADAGPGASGRPSLLPHLRSSPRCTRQQQQQRQCRALVPDTLTGLNPRMDPDLTGLGSGGSAWPPGPLGHQPAGSLSAPQQQQHARACRTTAEPPAAGGHECTAPMIPTQQAAVGAVAPTGQGYEGAPTCHDSTDSADGRGAGCEPHNTALGGNGCGGERTDAPEAVGGCCGAAASAPNFAAASCRDSEKKLVTEGDKDSERVEGGGGGSSGGRQAVDSAAAAMAAATSLQGGGGTARLRLQYRRQISFLTSLRCPRCGGGSIVPILYGFPSPKLMEGMRARRLILGGDHLIEDCHVWGCNRCGASFRHFPFDRPGLEGWVAELARPRPQRPGHLPHYTYEL